MKTLLAVDIGGTNTLLQLSSVEGEVISEQSFASQQYDSFDLLFGEFLAQDEIKNITLSAPVLVLQDQWWANKRL